MKEDKNRNSLGEDYLHVHPGSKLHKEVEERIKILEEGKTESIEISLETGKKVTFSKPIKKEVHEDPINIISGVRSSDEKFREYPDDEGVFIEFDTAMGGETKIAIIHHPFKEPSNKTKIRAIHYRNVKFSD